MNGIVAEVCLVNHILSERRLKIASYQRPYRWSEKNIMQLLGDVHSAQSVGKEKYRIGSAIFYSNLDENTLEIVDGQQRIVRILLILRYIYVSKKDEKKLKDLKLLDELKFNHQDSKENILNNTVIIGRWFADNRIDLLSFANYLLRNCEFVRVVVDDLSEAFQMFDSQNGRGKELEPYNLLKAYHIRAMEQDSQDIKIQCDKRWETATVFKTHNVKEAKDLLKQLFNEQLYRTRLWSRKEDAFSFTKENLDEFKGFTLNKNNQIQYPYQNVYALQYLSVKFYENILADMVNIKNRFRAKDPENINPFFNINQEIINGKSFFDYVEMYTELYKRLFENLSSYLLKEFKEFFKKYCFYENSTRTGDTYLRELYKSLIFILFDRFGEEGVLKFYKILYRWVYKTRLENGKVYRETVACLPNKKELNPFFIITYAKKLSDLYVMNKYIGVKEEKFDSLPDEVIAEIKGENK